MPTTARYKCENCSNIYTEDQLQPIVDISERVMPGDIMPAGECPDTDCGAVCHAYVPTLKGSTVTNNRSNLLIVTISGGVADFATPVPAGLRAEIIDFDNLKESVKASESIILSADAVEFLRVSHPLFFAQVEPLLVDEDEEDEEYRPTNYFDAEGKLVDRL